MLTPNSIAQPSLQSLIQRISHELSAKAVVLLQENGQVAARSGWLEEENFPSIAALVAAMIATGKSLGDLDPEARDEPNRFGWDSESTGLYAVAVDEGHWLAVLYDQPLNPGLYRMKVRKYAKTVALLGLAGEGQWEAEDIGTAVSEASVETTPEPEKPAPAEKTTGQKSALFGDVTDDEIDRLFENARS